jgi:lipoprotein NlpI
MRGVAGLLAGLWLFGGAAAAVAAGTDTDLLLNKAQIAQAQGERARALEMVNQAVALAPTNPQCYYVRGRLRAENNEHAQAILDFNEALRLEPRGGGLHFLRGLSHLKLGRLNESIADFDQWARVAPKEEPLLWQRGVALYLAGRYPDARRQFELYHTVKSNDLENAAWHFACVARAEGVTPARAALFPAGDDPRVPMTTLHQLLAGRARPEEVVARAQAGYASRAQLEEQLFRAHYYLGLYYDATGDPKLAREHIEKAASDFRVPTLLGDVAIVHAARLRQPAGGSP